jgi:hypothetical protein
MAGRVDNCFKSQRVAFALSNTKSFYEVDNHNTNFPSTTTRLLPSSIQYTSVRTRNSNFTRPFYGKTNTVPLRKDLDPDWDVKQECNNKYPSLSREQQMATIPVVMCWNNGTNMTDPKSVMNGLGNTDRSLNLLTANQFLANKPVMRQPNGIIV